MSEIVVPKGRKVTRAYALPVPYAAGAVTPTVEIRVGSGDGTTLLATLTATPDANGSIALLRGGSIRLTIEKALTETLGEGVYYFDVFAVVASVKTKYDEGTLRVTRNTLITPGRPVPVNTLAGVAKTVAVDDANTIIEATNAAAVTITIPPNASVAFPVGTSIRIRQMGAGKVTVAPGAAVTLRSAGGFLSTAAQYAEIEVTKRATNEWVVTGNRIA